VYAKSQIGREGPGGGSPGYKFGIGFVDQRKSYNDTGIGNFFIILLSFEIGKNGRTTIRVRHDFASSIYKSLIE
jgi:hypothetical protein